MTKPIYTSAADAEAAFYDALARADLNAMMAVWSEDEEAVCIHPGGLRLVGLATIREAWRQMFADGARLVVNLSQQVACATMMQTVHNVLEHIASEDDERAPTTLVATNVYSRGGAGWKMVMHHASPLPDLSGFAAHSTPRVVH